MRRAVLILSLSLALAAPAGAQPVEALRDDRAAQPRPAQSQVPPPPALAPVLPTPSPPVYDAAQCRLSCAQAYYFCLASDTPDECPGAWSQCRAACDAPSDVP